MEDGFTSGSPTTPASAMPPVPPGDLITLLAGVTPLDPAVRADLLAAYATLDDADRTLLWVVATEGALPERLAELLAVDDPDLVATSAHRARRRLRRAYVYQVSGSRLRTSACVAHDRLLVDLADGVPTPDAVNGSDPHVVVCGACRRLLEQLCALPSLLAVEAITAGVRRPPGPAPMPDPGTPTAAPLVISTTPHLDDAAPRTTATSATPTGATDHPVPPPVPDAAPSPSTAGRGRRRGAVIGIVAVFVVVAIGLTVWLVAGRAPADPVGPASTAPSTTPRPDRAAVVTEPTVTSSTSTTTSSTTTTSTVAPSTVAAAAGAARPHQPSQSWTPPAGSSSGRPQTSTATSNTPTTSPSTSPPTTGVTPSTTPATTQPDATFPPTTTGPPATG